MINENVKRIFNEEALDLINSKNDDYANPNDFYANFRLSEQAGIPMFIGIHVRLLDKISRLNSFISRFYRTGEITANHESIEDTLLDTINYSAIMLDAYRQYTKGKNHDGNNTRPTRQDTARNEAGTHLVHSGQDIDSTRRGEAGEGLAGRTRISKETN